MSSDSDTKRCHNAISRARSNSNGVALLYVAGDSLWDYLNPQLQASMKRVGAEMGAIPFVLSKVVNEETDGHLEPLAELRDIAFKEDSGFRSYHQQRMRLPFFAISQEAADSYCDYWGGRGWKRETV